MIKRPRWFIWLPLALLVVLLVTVWAADAWLESPAGKTRVEAAVADALNLPVHLAGDFNISFWPAVGIAGSNLEIGGSVLHAAAGPATGGPLLQCDSYHVSVALWPLLRGRLIVLAIRAADGRIDPGQLGQDDLGSSTESSQPLRLPRVDFLKLENFQVPLTGDENLTLMLDRMEVEGFLIDSATPLELAFSIVRSSASLAQFEIESNFKLNGDASQLMVEIGRLDLSAAGWEMKGGDGSLSWNRVRDEIQWDLEGQEPPFGKINFSGVISPGTLTGDLALDLNPPDQDVALAAGFSFRPMPEGMELTGIRLESADQRISGHGCLLTGVESSLNLDLDATRIDLERLQSWVPAAGGPGPGIDPANLDLPFDLRVRLSVDELHTGSAIAHGVKMATGGQPDCPFTPE